MNWVSTVPARNCWLLSTFCRKGMLVCRTEGGASPCSTIGEEAAEGASHPGPAEPPCHPVPQDTRLRSEASLWDDTVPSHQPPILAKCPECQRAEPTPPRPPNRAPPRTGAESLLPSSVIWKFVPPFHTAQETGQAFPTTLRHTAAMLPFPAMLLDRCPYAPHPQQPYSGGLSSIAAANSYGPLPPGHCCPGLPRPPALLLPSPHWGLLSPLQDGVLRAVTGPLLLTQHILPGCLILDFQLLSQDPKVEMPPGHLSLCGPHTSSPCLKSASLARRPLPSAGCSLSTPSPQPTLHHAQQPLVCHWPGQMVLPWSPLDSMSPGLQTCHLPGFKVTAPSSHTGVAS
uniref:Uncharacterized protein n=1 Tax=Mustela putorius furo TaxID=9669 RepID=M3Z5P1_MUSPF